MRPEEIGETLARVSLDKDDVEALGDMAHKNGDIERAVIFAGIGVFMDKAAVAEGAEEVATTEGVPDTTAAASVSDSSGNAFSRAFNRVRTRGVRRPKKYQDPEKHVYGSDFL